MKNILTQLSLVLILLSYQNCGGKFEGVSFQEANTSSQIDNVSPMPKEPDLGKIPEKEDVEIKPETIDHEKNKFIVNRYFVKSIKANSVVIEWTLSESGSGQIQYGKTTSYGEFTDKENSFDFQTHIQVIENLDEDTKYYFKINSLNDRGDEALNEQTDLFFKTEKKVVVEPQPEKSIVGSFNYPPAQITTVLNSVESIVNPPQPSQSVSGELPNTLIRAVSAPGERHEYSRRQPWNSDETVIYIATKAYSYPSMKLIRDFSSLVSSEWYASHKDPDVIFGTAGSRFVKVYISSGKTELIVDVGEPILLGEYEGGISFDDRYALVDSGKRRLRVIDIQEKKIISGPYNIAGDINGGDISPDGNYVVWTAGGITYYSDKFFKNVVKTKFATPHSDLCVDVNGDQVSVMFDGSSQISILRLKDNYTFVKRTPYTGGGHVSCTNFKRPGWTYVSSYRGGQRAFSVKLDYSSSTTLEDWGFVREYLVDYNNYDYDSQPKMAASPSGTKVIYTSTWNKKTKYRDFVIEYKQ